MTTYGKHWNLLVHRDVQRPCCLFCGTQKAQIFKGVKHAWLVDTIKSEMQIFTDNILATTLNISQHATNTHDVESEGSICICCFYWFKRPSKKRRRMLPLQFLKTTLRNLYLPGSKSLMDLRVIHRLASSLCENCNYFLTLFDEEEQKTLKRIADTKKDETVKLLCEHYHKHAKGGSPFLLSAQISELLREQSRRT